MKNGQVRCRDESAIFPLLTDLIVLVARHVEGADHLQAAFICSVVTLTFVVRTHERLLQGDQGTRFTRLDFAVTTVRAALWLSCHIRTPTTHHR